MTVVALDAMGGDSAPEATVAGALAAALAGAQVALVGDRAVLEPAIARAGGAPSTLQVVHAADAIEMGEHAAMEARTRRDSSIYVGMQLVKQGEAGAFVSAGNTGAVYAIALVLLGRLKGVERPALGAVLPLPDGPALLLDAGANAEVRASHLVQFARIGSAYMQTVHGIARPRVGLLNIGEEPTKGTPVTIEAHTLLSAATGLHFVGNVEGREVLAHRADVVVADGFSGNVMLKTAEGASEVLMAELRRAATSSLRGRIGGLLLRPALRDVAARMDYRRYGAAPLLGLDGAVFVGHGRSDAQAITSAIMAAALASDRGVQAALAASVREVD